MRISVWDRGLDDNYLKLITQLGADAIDFGTDSSFPGVQEQGYPDLDELLKIKKKIHSWGLEINRVTLPNISEKFMSGQDDSEIELENTTKALHVFAEAGCPLVRQRFAGDTFPQLMTRYQSRHRGGYKSRGESRYLTKGKPQTPALQDLELWWERFCLVYQALVPIAEDTGIKLAIHPSDVPNPDTPLGGIGFHRVIDFFPSRSVDYLYCCGTRSEAGGSAIVIDEIKNYGRKGKIFMVHLPNVRGCLATAGGFEEVLLDDGDMNLFKILRHLDKVRFDGCINADHIPTLEGDRGNLSHGLSYSIGYIKALFAALAE
jgi:mannonate dehydratase